MDNNNKEKVSHYKKVMADHGIHISDDDLDVNEGSQIHRIVTELSRTPNK